MSLSFLKPLSLRTLPTHVFPKNFDLLLFKKQDYHFFSETWIIFVYSFFSISFAFFYISFEDLANLDEDFCLWSHPLKKKEHAFCRCI